MEHLPSFKPTSFSISRITFYNQLYCRIILEYVQRFSYHHYCGLVWFLNSCWTWESASDFSTLVSCCPANARWNWFTSACPSTLNFNPWEVEDPLLFRYNRNPLIPLLQQTHNCPGNLTVPVNGSFLQERMNCGNDNFSAHIKLNKLIRLHYFYLQNLRT